MCHTYIKHPPPSSPKHPPFISRHTCAKEEKEMVGIQEGGGGVGGPPERVISQHKLTGIIRKAGPLLAHHPKFCLLLPLH